MEYRDLGASGLKVSEFCFGALPMGPMQKDISPEEGGALMRMAFEHGVNFVDTAQMYRTYPHIRAALAGYGGEVVIASKSVAATYAEMEQAVQEALSELGRDYVDIFLLHAARVKPDVFEQRAGAWECLQYYKKQGCLKAIGISTHSVAVAQEALKHAELDILFPIINYKGMGILDGDLAGMRAVIAEAAAAGKGVYAMKALAGGALLSELPQAVDFVRKLAGVQSLALGITSEAELRMDLRLFAGESLSKEELAAIKCSKRLHFMPFCSGCGNCSVVCPSLAISMVGERPQVDVNKCVLCGYCTPRCPEFAIRLR